VSINVVKHRFKTLGLGEDIFLSQPNFGL